MTARIRSLHEKRALTERPYRFLWFLPFPVNGPNYGAMPSVISIFVPHGSAMNATRIVLTKLLGVSP
jgi:hypothetical protein